MASRGKCWRKLKECRAQGPHGKGDGKTETCSRKSVSPSFFHQQRRSMEPQGHEWKARPEVGLPTKCRDVWFRLKLYRTVRRPLKCFRKHTHSIMAFTYSMSTLWGKINPLKTIFYFTCELKILVGFYCHFSHGFLQFKCQNTFKLEAGHEGERRAPKALPNIGPECTSSPLIRTGRSWHQNLGRIFDCLIVSLWKQKKTTLVMMIWCLYF